MSTDVNVQIIARDRTGAAIRSAQKGFFGLGKTIVGARDAVLAFGVGFTSLDLLFKTYEFQKRIVLLTNYSKALDLNWRSIERLGKSVKLQGGSIDTAFGIVRTFSELSKDSSKVRGLGLDPRKFKQLNPFLKLYDIADASGQGGLKGGNATYSALKKILGEDQAVIGTAILRRNYGKTREEFGRINKDSETLDDKDIKNLKASFENLTEASDNLKEKFVGLVTAITDFTQNAYILAAAIGVPILAVLAPQTIGGLGTAIGGTYGFSKKGIKSGLGYLNNPRSVSETSRIGLAVSSRNALIGSQVGKVDRVVGSRLQGLTSKPSSAIKGGASLLAGAAGAARGVLGRAGATIAGSAVVGSGGGPYGVLGGAAIGGIIAFWDEIVYGAEYVVDQYEAYQKKVDLFVKRLNFLKEERDISGPQQLYGLPIKSSVLEPILPSSVIERSQEEQEQESLDKQIEYRRKAALIQEDFNNRWIEHTRTSVETIESIFSLALQSIATDVSSWADVIKSVFLDIRNEIIRSSVRGAITQVGLIDLGGRTLGEALAAAIGGAIFQPSVLPGDNDDDYRYPDTSDKSNRTTIYINDLMSYQNTKSQLESDMALTRELK